MLNRYPLWKYLLIIVVIVVGFIYALPNLYDKNPSVQISSSSEPMDDETQNKIVALLERNNLTHKALEVSDSGFFGAFLMRSVNSSKRKISLQVHSVMVMSSRLI